MVHFSFIKIFRNKPVRSGDGTGDEQNAKKQNSFGYLNKRNK